VCIKSNTIEAKIKLMAYIILRGGGSIPKD